MMVNKKHENQIGHTKPTIRQCVFCKGNMYYYSNNPKHHTLNESKYSVVDMPQTINSCFCF